jgi:sugar/nucleoside kinase (ribokinase family)
VLAFAAQAAAITCSRRGADLPRRAELQAAPTSN